MLTIKTTVLFVCSAILLALTPAWATEFDWHDLPPLPDETGFGGPAVGVHNGALIVAGGANFPEGPPWEHNGLPGGPKVWHDRIFVLESKDRAWIEAGRLPMPLAYAAAVSHTDGVYLLGGETFGSQVAGEPAASFPVADVLLLAWRPETGSLEIRREALPPLPRASHYHGAALLGNTIYVTASHAETPASLRLDSKSFWSMNLASPPDSRVWAELTPWPGAPRYQMAVAVQASGADDHYASPQCLYLFGGSTWANDAAGNPALGQFEYFTDNYRYNPLKQEWTAIAPLPAVEETRAIDVSGYIYDSEARVWQRPSGGDTSTSADIQILFAEQPRPSSAAPVIEIGPSHILLFGGSTGRYVTLDVQDRPPFPRDVLAYHTITDTWTRAGEMPEAVVTTSAVRWGGTIVLPSGETRPGVRTNRVQAMQVRPERNSFGGLNMTVLVVYLAALVVIGTYFSRKGKSTEDFFLAGRRIPWWAAGISIYATQLSAITFVSLPAVAYATNWLVYPAQLTILFIAPIVIIFYLPFFRRLHITTAYEYLERRFSLPVRLFGSLSFIVFQLGRMAVVVYLPALALAEVTGLSVTFSILIMGALATLYTVLGGMEAVIWTDVLQVFVLAGGLGVALVLIVVELGGLGPVLEVVRADGKLTLLNLNLSTEQMATWLVLAGSFMLNFGPYTTDQAVIQRYLTTKDERAAGKSILLNGLISIPASISFFCLGAALYAFFKAHPDLLWIGMQNDRIFPLYVAEHMPAGLAGLVIAGIFAASMSSLDSSMHSIATALTTDFYQRFRPATSDTHRYHVARFLTLLIGVFGTVSALTLATYDIQSLFFFFQKLLGLTSSGIVGIFMLGIFTRRANSIGALTGAAASIGVLYYIITYTSINFYLYAVIGTAVVLLTGYLTSLLTPPSSKDLQGLTFRSLIKP